METTEEKKRWLKTKKAKILLITGIATLIIVTGMVVGIHIYYADRWYTNTWIGDRDVSGMKYEDSRKLINNVYKHYQLQILARNSGVQNIAKDSIEYEVNIHNSLKDEFDKQHDSSPVLSLGTKKQIEIELNATYNKDKLNNLLSTSSLVTSSEAYPVTQPKDAKVILSEEKKYLVVQKEDLGNTMNYEKFYQEVENSLLKGRETLDLNDETAHPDIYIKPQVYDTEPELQRKVDACNPIVLRWLTWKYEDSINVTVGPEQIYRWCNYKDGKVTFKKKAIEKWVEKLCFKYKTVGVTRTFTNHANKKVSVTGGDYGWQLVYDSMVKQLMSVLKKKIDWNKQKAYMENPDTEHKKELTTKKKPVFANTAFAYNKDDKTLDWDTENFTEISLADQKVYVWRNGKVAFKCKTISGRPVKDRKTRTGAYYIKQHERHRILRGDDYETPVDNWVRITWTGTGFHAAPWQPWSRWSKTLYQTRGSHGCLNLNYADSNKIYELVKYREMVFIY